MISVISAWICRYSATRLSSSACNAARVDLSGDANLYKSEDKGPCYIAVCGGGAGSPLNDRALAVMRAFGIRPDPSLGPPHGSVCIMAASKHPGEGYRIRDLFAWQTRVGFDVVVGTGALVVEFD